MNENDLFFRVTVALAAGLLIGMERGWQDRDAASGRRVAGIRTFALIALLGTGWGLLLDESNLLLLGFAFFGFAVVLAAAQVTRAVRLGDYGITTAVAGLLTFVLGAAAVQGHVAFVASVAVIAATLLGVKPILHGWVKRLEQKDLFAVFKMLLISVVLLPVLPNEGYGPWGFFNPYEIWWMVVLIAGVSFSGYFAMKVAGAKRGVGLTALFGGLVASTAVTLNFSKIGRDSPQHSGVLTAGILIASGTMFPRSILLAGVIHSPMIPLLAVPLGAMALICFAGAAYFWKSSEKEADPGGEGLRNPFEIITALKFGALLTLVMFLVRALRDWFGDMGIYAVGVLSGITDVDAVTLSMSRLASEDLAATVAERAIVLAVIANTLFKVLLTAFIARGKMARRVAVPLSLTAVAGIGISMV
ncbi:MAG: MgtC/SapB family protein [Gammaproteobacteria bacterium]|nr:MgtC/SapB family protein [Gammaproteobacteria bacterium]